MQIFGWRRSLCTAVGKEGAWPQFSALISKNRDQHNHDIYLHYRTYQTQNNIFKAIKLLGNLTLMQ